MSTYRKILVAYDGTESSRAALTHAAALSTALGAALHAFWVSPPPPDDAMFIDVPDNVRVEEQAKHERRTQERQATLVAEVRRLAGADVPLEVRAGHHLAEAIVGHAAAAGFDLVVLGHETHTTFWERVMGHTGGRLTHDAPCDVLVVCRPPPDTA